MLVIALQSPSQALGCYNIIVYHYEKPDIYHCLLS